MAAISADACSSVTPSRSRPTTRRFRRSRGLPAASGSGSQTSMRARLARSASGVRTPATVWISRPICIGWPRAALPAAPRGPASSGSTTPPPAVLPPHRHPRREARRPATAGWPIAAKKSAVAQATCSVRDCPCSMRAGGALAVRRDVRERGGARPGSRGSPVPIPRPRRLSPRACRCSKMEITQASDRPPAGRERAPGPRTRSQWWMSAIARPSVATIRQGGPGLRATCRHAARRSLVRSFQTGDRRRGATSGEGAGWAR